jgi:hypothetical protein
MIKTEYPDACFWVNTERALLVSKNCFLAKFSTAKPFFYIYRNSGSLSSSMIIMTGVFDT